MKKKIILIIGFLAAIAIVFVALQMESIDEKGTRHIATSKQIVTIKQAIQTYEILTGEYPKSVEDLTSPVGPFKKGILRNNWLKNDGWGTPFQLTFHDDRIEIRSAGLDKKFGTADDLVNLFTAAPVEPAAQP